MRTLSTVTNKLAPLDSIGWEDAMEETTPETADEIPDVNQEIVKKKPGRPKLYPGRFQSVRGTLQKILSLDFDVFSSWNNLRDKATHECNDLDLP